MVRSIECHHLQDKGTAIYSLLFLVFHLYRISLNIQGRYQVQRSHRTRCSLCCDKSRGLGEHYKRFRCSTAQIKKNHRWLVRNNEYTWTSAGSRGHRFCGYEIPLPATTIKIQFRHKNPNLQLDVCRHDPLPSEAVQESPMARSKMLSSKPSAKVAVTATDKAAIIDNVNIVKEGS